MATPCISYKDKTYTEREFKALLATGGVEEFDLPGKAKAAISAKKFVRENAKKSNRKGNRDAMEAVKQFKKDTKDFVPQSVGEMVTNYFAQGCKINSKDFADVFPKSSTEYKDSKFRDEKAPHLDDLAMQIAEAWKADYGGEVDTQEIHKEILEVLNSKDLISVREDIAAKHAERKFIEENGGTPRQLEEAKAAHEEEQAMIKHYGMDEEEAETAEHAYDEADSKPLTEEEISKLAEEYDQSEASKQLYGEETKQGAKGTEDAENKGIGKDNSSKEKRTREDLEKEVAEKKAISDKATADYEAGKASLDKNLNDKQQDAFAKGKAGEGVLGDDTAGKKQKVADLKTKAEEAKAEYDKVRNLLDEEMNGQGDLFEDASDKLFKLGIENFKKAWNNPTGGLALNPKMIEAAGQIGRGLLGRTINGVQVTMANVIDHIKTALKNDYDKDVDESADDIRKEIEDSAEHDYNEIEGKWLGNTAVRIQQANTEAANIQKEIQATVPTKNAWESSKLVPDVLKRDYTKAWQNIDKAIQLYNDLFQNPEHAQTLYAQLTPEQQALVDLSQNLTPEQKAIADKIRDESAKVGEEAKDAGIISVAKENYVFRVWDLGDKNAGQGKGKFQSSTGHSKQRKFETVLEGWAAGYKQKIEGASNNLSALKTEMGNVIENRDLINAGAQIKNADGHPFFSTYQYDGYKKIEHPSFKKWAFAGKLEDYSAAEQQSMGQRKDILITQDGTVMQKQEIYAPEAIAKDLNNITGTSKLNELPGVETITQFNARAKATILLSSLYHHLAFTTNHMLSGDFNSIGDMNPFSAYKQGQAAIMNSSPELELLVRNGLTLGKVQDWEEGLVTKKTAFGKWLDEKGIAKDARGFAVDLYNAQSKWLFEQYGAGLKATDSMRALSKILRDNEAMNPNDAAKIVSKFQNQNYGGLNLRFMKRNPTTQHALRLLLLAPDWSESNLQQFRGMAAAGKEGEFYRGMWARVLIRGLGAMALANAGLAMIPDGEDGKTAPQRAIDRFQKAFKEGNLNWMKIDISPIAHKFGAPQDKSYYFSPFRHYTDPIRLASTLVDPIVHAGGAIAKAPSVTENFEPANNQKSAVDFFMGKGSVFVTSAKRAITSQDWKGDTYTDLDELLGLDDKGEYTKKQSGHDKGDINPKTGNEYVKNQEEHEIGDEKGGKLKGKLTKFNLGGAHGISAPQIPSLLLEEFRSILPTQVQNVSEYSQGEQDGFTTITNSIGLGITKATPKKEKEDKPDNGPSIGAQIKELDKEIKMKRTKGEDISGLADKKAKLEMKEREQKAKKIKK